MFRVIATLLLVGSLLSPAVRAEVVTISVEQQTTFGSSVFVTAALPELGGDSVTGSIKLSPHAYPVWQATFDLPPGVTITPKFYLRSDAPANLGSAANGTLASTGAPISTAPRNLPDIAHHVVTGDDVTGVSAQLGAGSPTIIPFTSAPHEASLLLHSGLVPATHANHRAPLRIDMDGFLLPTDGTVTAGYRETWWRHEHAFHYEPTHPDNVVAPHIETFTFEPENFDTRTIRVWLPRDYDRNTTTRYPVLYAQDGQNVFFPGGAFGSWDMDLIAADLVRRGEIPEIIIVAIDNSSDRFAEYIPEYATLMGVDGRGGEFLTMIRDELMPVINASYRTLTGPQHTAHIGSSLGGLLGFHAANEFEATFGAVAALSPSFQVATVENLNRAALPTSDWGRLYIDSGTAGGSADGYANTITIRDAMIETGHALGPRFLHTVGHGDGHNEAAWKRRLPNVLRWIYGSTTPPEESAPEAFEAWILY